VAVRLSIVIPTLGRPTLERTLASCSDADEIVVVHDTVKGGSTPSLPPNAVLIEGRWGVTGGHAGRQEGIRRATGTHLAFMDDDDVYTPGAIQMMRDAACERPVIFRMDHYSHGVLWRDPVVRFGNVSTQMYVVPNEPARLGSWEPHAPGLPEPGGDYTFIAGCVTHMGEPVWREEIISTLRPELHTKTISIVTPWKDHLELRDDYFDAVGWRRGTDEVIVVDNASDPPLPFGTVQLSENLGFAGACNVGLSNASCDVVLFLNNDVQGVRSTWLRELREAVEPGVLAGPLRNGNHADVDGESFPYIDGWCLAGMREDLLRLGGFDEGLAEPAYYSDNLLCLEARAAGMTLRDVRVGLRHLENVTAGRQFTPSVQAATTANRARYERRVRQLV
jgi:GT2 family glycosyltransferase